MHAGVAAWAADQFVLNYLQKLVLKPAAYPFMRLETSILAASAETDGIARSTSFGIPHGAQKLFGTDRCPTYPRAFGIVPMLLGSAFAWLGKRKCSAPRRRISIEIVLYACIRR
jgi:hypothetical protein